MTYAQEVLAELDNFLKFDIEYNVEFEQYLFKGKWTLETNETYFTGRVEKLKSLLRLHLITGKNNSEFLDLLIDQTGSKIDWLSDNNYYNLSFLELSKIRIKDNVFYENLPPSEKYTHEFITKYITEKNNESVDDSDYFFYLLMSAKNSNFYSKPLDFQKTKLLYSIRLYYKSLLELYGFIESLKYDSKYTDFSSYKDPNNLKENFSSEFEIANNNRIKCNVALNKIGTANLFKLLSEANIFYFDKVNDAKNNVMMNKFIENNFTYLGTEDTQRSIKNINKQFSEINDLDHEETQKKVLDNLIDLLQKKRKKIK